MSDLFFLDSIRLDHVHLGRVRATVSHWDCVSLCKVIEWCEFVLRAYKYSIVAHTFLPFSLYQFGATIRPTAFNVVVFFVCFLCVCV